MCRLCQASSTGGRVSTTSSVDTSAALCKHAAHSAAKQLSMTWSKESIGNTSVEKTPSKNGSRQKSAESIRRRRPSSTRIVPKARSIESVRRKYAPKKQLTVYSPKRDSVTSLSTSFESDGSPQTVDDAPTGPSKATVRRTHAFRRSSRYGGAFREHGTRVLRPLYHTVGTLDTSLCISDTFPGSQPTTANTTSRCATCTGLAELDGSANMHHTQQVEDDCSVEAVTLSFRDDDDDEDEDCDSDVEPEHDVLHTQSSEPQLKTEVATCTDDDVKGSEPVELLDTAANVEEGLDESSTSASAAGKRPSLLKRMLSKSSSVLKTSRHSRVSCPTTSRFSSHEAIGTCSSSHLRRRRADRVPVRRMIRRPRKAVVMGDMFSGKSSLILAYCCDRFSTNYVPTLISTCSTDAKVFGESIELVVVDVGGRDDYTKLRKCAYHKVDVIILCYAANSPSSLERITSYWLPEIKRYCPKAPIVLVATKKDIRDDALYENPTISSVVSIMSGKKVAESIGANGFLECSARFRDNTRNVFEMAAKVALQKSRRRRK